MNICMIGYGMMGTWHSEALRDQDCCLHTLVGRRPEAVKEFAQRYDYQKYTTDLNEALADPEVDAVIVASPSEQHAEMALACIEQGKPTLLEIPIAMNLADAERVVAAAEQHDVMLAMVHPLRFPPQREPLRQRIAAGEEHIRHIAGRFFIHRLSNVGATGYQRSWTDNLLWHHITHLLDFGLWMLEPVDSPIRIRDVYSHYPALDPNTGIPMETIIVIETEADQTLLVSGSYYSSERLYDTFIVTDQDSYRFNILDATLTTKAGSETVMKEQDNCALATQDFIAALREGRAPKVPGRSVLPAMRILQQVQDRWDEKYGVQSLPGRT